MTVNFVCPPVRCLMARLDGHSLPPPRLEDEARVKDLIRQCENVHIERGRKILLETPEVAVFDLDGPALLGLDGIGEFEAINGFGVSRGEPRRCTNDVAARARAREREREREQERLSKMIRDCVRLAEVRGSTCAEDGCQRRPAHSKRTGMLKLGGLCGPHAFDAGLQMPAGYCKVCGKSAVSGGKVGLCVIHGGGLRCTVVGCDKGAAAGGKVGYCLAHGGGPGPRCTVNGCGKAAARGGAVGLCVDHGGGPRCTADGCDKAAARLVGGGVDRCVDHRRSDQCTHCNRSLLYRNRRKATLGPAGRGTLCTSCGEKFRKGTWIADPENLGKLLKV